MGNRSHKIDGHEDARWYEEPYGICVVVKKKDEILVLPIPWHELSSAVLQWDEFRLVEAGHKIAVEPNDG